MKLVYYQRLNNRILQKDVQKLYNEYEVILSSMENHEWIDYDRYRL